MISFLLGVLEWVVNLLLHWIGVILPFLLFVMFIVIVVNRLTRPPPIEHLIDYDNVSLPTGDGDYSRYNINNVY